YLIVGRFVPENNYEAMIREFMKSKTKRDLVIISNVEKNAFYNDLNKHTNFEKDERIKFVGTVYDQEQLKYIRENAYAYLHGHEVGGTNPSLLEALGSTKVNLLLDVGFNREVGENGALYWKKNTLSDLIDEVDTFTESDVDKLNVLS
ncbi:glycosyl transferase, partial [Enterococcus cecorum]|nr:glycosyl transferase [Enterococcus cecorum]